MDTKDEKSEKEPSAAPNAPNEITLHYVKSNQFRVVHVDGAWGGISPAGEFIEMAFFNERQPIPLQITQELKDGTLGKETSRVGRDGVVREVEFNAIMNVDTANVLADWLLAQIETLKAVAAKRQEKK